MTSPSRAWAEINLSALRHNFRLAHQRAGTPLMAVVKADAYGHGLEKTAHALLEEPALSHFGVANVLEARRLRNAGIQHPIYILGASTPEERAEIISLKLTPCLSSADEGQHFSQLAEQMGKTLTAHLALDTGMGRGGLLPNDAPNIYRQLLSLPHLKIEGLGSHLHSADEDNTATQNQIKLFQKSLTELEEINPFQEKHLFNSAGLLNYTSAQTTLARPGIMLYGADPFFGKTEAALTLKSRITLVRKLPAGHGISYGSTFKTEKPTTVATIGIGYGDGYPRALSGQDAHVIINGHRCPLLGRVTMDQLIIDISQLAEGSVKTGTEVELFGPQLPIQEIAQKAGTIPYEILTGITPRVERRYEKC